VTPVSVEAEGALTTWVNPACLAADAETSTLVDGFDADVAAAAGPMAMGPTTARTVAPLLSAATSFTVSFLTNTSF
jgi:hypothetical protein